MDIRNLKLFVHLTGSLHFGKTADAMHVSPSTLSRCIQRLEMEVGERLLVRDNRTVTLTEVGRQFQLFAQQTLAQWEELKSTLGQQKGELEGILRVYCSVTAAYSHLPPILDKFRLCYPRVEIMLKTGDAAEAVAEVQQGLADVAIAAHPDQLSTQIQFTPLDQVPLSIIAPTIPCQVQQQVTQSTIPWADIPFILPEHGPARRRIDRWFRKLHFKPHIYAKVSGHEALVSMVALGCGVGIAPEVVVENSPVRDRVQCINTGVALEPFELGVVNLKTCADAPLVAAFLGMLGAESDDAIDASSRNE